MSFAFTTHQLFTDYRPQMNTHPFWPRHAFLFKGGGGGGTPSMPAPPAPPASATSIEVTQAKLDAKRQAKARGGIDSTILAGANPLGDGNGSGPVKSTLLGG